TEYPPVGFPLFHVDGFTDRPFAGNPAAVCRLPAWRDDQWLQAVAREMNLSETAFGPIPSPGLHPPPTPERKTGSAPDDDASHRHHCQALDFWRKRLGKSDFVAYQASARGGVVKVRVTGDRAILGARAVIVAQGELLA